ncbi:ABC transporter ATP-binding protein [Naasia lichenicola]|uniref:ABC transporter ATP-binding protein n=1 Tax=Naasia lichenicola TaxID=2565933 RepID=UPI0018EE588B|nr:ABC transporter ATP-binding protein [Naasia lichenicola]
MEGLDLRIDAGERVLLLGASGAGKSTLLQGLAGLLGGSDEGDQRGELTLDGVSAAGLRGRAGLLLQDPDAQIVLARVGDDVAFGPENLGVAREEIWPLVVEALDAVGLDLPLDHSTSALSGGQKQRLALAGIIAMRPGLVLLDEPTANLDPDGVREVVDAIERMLARTGATLVVVEHRVATWLPIVDRVVVLAAGGGVLADGAPADVLGSAADSLVEAGVWVPGRATRFTPLRSRSDLEVMRAIDLAVGRGTRIVQSGIDLRLAAGSALCITGPNGAGKSTAALALGGLLPPLGGEVQVGEALAARGERRPIRWSSRELITRIGSVFQDPEHQFVAPTVRAELAIGPTAAGLGARDVDARIDPLLDALRLRAIERANPFTLSGGEKRRLSVATALAAGPSVLILDEPTFGQDARTWAELVRLLRGLQEQGTALIAVTHDQDFVDAVATDRLELHPLPVESVA